MPTVGSGRYSPGPGMDELLEEQRFLPGDTLSNGGLFTRAARFRCYRLRIEAGIRPAGPLRLALGWGSLSHREVLLLSTLGPHWRLYHHEHQRTPNRRLPALGRRTRSLLGMVRGIPRGAVGPADRSRYPRGAPGRGRQAR